MFDVKANSMWLIDCEWQIIIEGSPETEDWVWSLHQIQWEWSVNSCMSQQLENNNYSLQRLCSLCKYYQVYELKLQNGAKSFQTIDQTKLMHHKIGWFNLIPWRFYFPGKIIHSMVAHLDAVTSLAVDPNGLYLLSGSEYMLAILLCIRELY